MALSLPTTPVEIFFRLRRDLERRKGYVHSLTHQSYAWKRRTSSRMHSTLKLEFEEKRKNKKDETEKERNHLLNLRVTLSSLMGEDKTWLMKLVGNPCLNLSTFMHICVHIYLYMNMILSVSLIHTASWVWSTKAFPACHNGHWTKTNTMKSLTNLHPFYEQIKRYEQIIECTSPQFASKTTLNVGIVVPKQRAIRVSACSCCLLANCVYAAFFTNPKLQEDNPKTDKSCKFDALGVHWRTLNSEMKSEYLLFFSSNMTKGY